MPSLKQKPYVSTYPFTLDQRRKTPHKDIDSTIKQLTRPTVTVPRGVKKDYVLFLWVQQDLQIVNREISQENAKKKPNAKKLKDLANEAAKLQVQLPVVQAALGQSGNNPAPPKKPKKKPTKKPTKKGAGAGTLVASGGGGGGSGDDTDDHSDDDDFDDGDNGGNGGDSEPESEPESDGEPQGNASDPLDWITDALPQPIEHPFQRYRRTVAIFNPKDLPENASMDGMHGLEQRLYGMLWS